LSDASYGDHSWIVGQAHLDFRVAWRRPQQLTGHVEHRISPALGRNTSDQLSGLHHFAGLGGSADYCATGVRLELGVAHLILGDLQLRLRGIELGLGGVAGLLGPLILDARGHISRQ